MSLRRWALLVIAAVIIGLHGCVSTLLPRVDIDAEGPQARPDALAALGDDPAVATSQDWTDRRAPLLREAFARAIYGAAPRAGGAAQVLERRMVDPAAFDGAGRVEELLIDARPPQGAARFNLILVTPVDAAGPVPVIVMQNFCGNRAAMDGREDVSPPLGPYPSFCDGGWLDPVATYIFGMHINAPPVADILAHGYGAAMFYAGDVVPDSTLSGEAALAELFPASNPQERPGAIAAWAWAYSRAVDVLAAEPGVDARRIALWGHSRNAKSALLAAALDPRIAMVIAHQSGTGGASLARGGTGESVAQITEAYPHWFAPAYAAYAEREDALPVDQHLLLALIAPRPVLLGNAERDAWSDPNGAFRAALGADPVYELMGSDGLTQRSLADYEPAADLALFIRPGLHGVTRRDWREFLAFADAHFAAAPDTAPDAPTNAPAGGAGGPIIAAPAAPRR